MNTPPVQNQLASHCETGRGTASAGRPDQNSLPPWFSAREIARALGCDKKTVRRQARREGWPVRLRGNREEFSPPPMVARMIIPLPEAAREYARPTLVKFSDLVHSDPQREKVLRREEAVKLLLSKLHLGKETALETCAAAMRAKYADFACSPRALRRWLERYQAVGIDGLVEQKRGIVGAAPFAADLTDEQLLSATATAIGRGQWKPNKTTGRLNVAAAFREMVANPTIRGEARSWLHGARASKSSYPPSFGSAIRGLVSPLAATMLQVGRKAARLDGPYTNADYSDGCADHALTADDMTANCYVWTEWGNERGFVLLRPQLLAVLHVGSLCWLNTRAIISGRRLKDGQTTGSSVYDKDDVFGLFGDTFDEFGIFSNATEPDLTLILEGGIWQSKVITGSRVLPDDKMRFAGLRSLGRGVKIIHTRTPLGKAAIEGAFHVLQGTADDVLGFCGRDERRDCPEQTKQNLARVRSGEHPRSMFLHIAEYNAHLQSSMQNINTTRNDGKICGGLAPLEKFRELRLQTVVFPDRLKWMYRSAYSVEKITRNGFAITRKVAGLHARYEYDHACLENYRGMRVCGFWNDSNPDTDAVIYSIRNGQPDKLICVASRAANPSRLGAAGEEMRAESTRKALKVSYAGSQAKALAPYLQRNVKLAELAPRAAAVGDQIEAARKSQERRERARKSVAQFDGGAEELLEGKTESRNGKTENNFQEASLQVDHDAGCGQIGAPENAGARQWSGYDDESVAGTSYPEMSEGHGSPAAMALGKRPACEDASGSVTPGKSFGAGAEPLTDLCAEELL